MTEGLLMIARTDPAGDIESELALAVITDDGRLCLKLDDGQRLELDYDELLAIGTDECAAAAHEEAA